MRHILSGVYTGMKTRCYNKNTIEYKNYGGRGITVCEEWKNSSKVFYSDMMDGYSKGLQIDRIDNNGNYCKENCRWVTRKENMRNRRVTIMHSSGITLADYAEKNNISYKEIYKQENKVAMSIHMKSYYKTNKEYFCKKQKEYYRSKLLKINNSK